jgi:hypothetical protein
MLFASAAHAQSMERFQLREEFRTGRDIRRYIDTASTLPENKRFFELTLVQKQVTRSWYVGLSEVDDPPYREHGPGFTSAVLQRIALGQEVQGELALEVVVGPDGKVVSVTAIRAPSSLMGKMAAHLIKSVHFSPGLCGSLPCTMSYPVAIWLTSP